MSGALTGRRVMVVEDELLIAMLIEDTLADEGSIIVGPYTSVPDALKAAATVTVDFALLDVNLRGEKVYPVGDLLETRGIPFLLLSGYGQDAIPHDRQHWKAISKPFEVAELVARLGEAMRRNPDPGIAPGLGF